MKYCLFESGDVLGPAPIEELLRRGGFGPGSLVCPEAHSEEQDYWKPAQEYADFHFQQPGKESAAKVRFQVTKKSPVSKDLFTREMHKTLEELETVNKLDADAFLQPIEAVAPAEISSLPSQPEPPKPEPPAMQPQPPENKKIAHIQNFVRNYNSAVSYLNENKIMYSSKVDFDAKKVTLTLLDNEQTTNLENKEFEFDPTPLDETCDCYACKNHTKAYIRHIYRQGESNAAILLSMHNIRFLVKLMEDARNAILEDRFKDFCNEIYEGLHKK